MICIQQGLDSPIVGEPRQVVEQCRAVLSSAVLGCVFPGMFLTLMDPFDD